MNRVWQCLQRMNYLDEISMIERLAFKSPWQQGEKVAGGEEPGRGLGVVMVILAGDG